MIIFNRFLYITLLIMVNIQIAQSSIEQEPVIIGHQHNFYSNVLKENKGIYVSLPHKYHERTQKYPVVVVMEAEYLFEATTAVTNFIQKRSKMPQSIVIGITTGAYENRKKLSFARHGGKPEQYLEFLEEELIPHIERNFRANSNRTIIGLSPSNGIVFEALFTRPNLFKNYIALSTHWDWNPRKGVTMVDQLIKTITQLNFPDVNIYMGTADGDMRYSEAAYKKAVEKLNVLPKTNVNYKVDLLENEEHYIMTFAGLRNGFKLFYPDSEWGFPVLMDHDNPVEALKNHYQNLSKAYGFDIYPVEDGHPPGDHILGWADAMVRFDKFTNQQAIDILELAINYYPNSANAHMRLAELLVIDGKGQTAQPAATRAMELMNKFHADKKESFQHRFARLNLNSLLNDGSEL